MIVCTAYGTRARVRATARRGGHVSPGVQSQLPLGRLADQRQARGMSMVADVVAGWTRGRTVMAGALLGALLGGWQNGGAGAQERQGQERHPRLVVQGARMPWTVWGRGPMLGVTLDLDHDTDLDGVRVSRVRSGGPADEAGILEGDVIVSLDGHRLIDELDDEDEWHLDDGLSLPGQRLVALVRGLEAGSEVDIVVRRGDGDTRRLTVILEEVNRWSHSMEELTERMREMGERLRDTHRWQPRDGYDWPRPDISVTPLMTDAVTAYGDAVFPFGVVRSHGLDIVELNAGLGSYFGTEEGVLIAEVTEGSSLGLIPGDVVVKVDGRTVDDGRELVRILGSYEEGEELTLEIWRDGARTTVVGTVE